MNESLKALEIVKDILSNHQSMLETKDKRFEYINIIEKDLEGLEELKQIWDKEEWCKGIPLSADGLKSLFNYNEELFEENLGLDKKALELEKENKYIRVRYEELDNENRKLKNKIQVLEQSVDDTYDVSQEIILDLKEKNQKFKNAIEIVKHTINCKYKIWYWYENNFITKQEYELLKEVLGNDI